MEPLLELKNISHAYHTKGGETSALSNLSFQVFPGEFLAIIGPSGCGKTTILSIIAGLIPAESGEVLFKGKPMPKQNKELGYMLQKDQLFEWRSIYKNVTLGIELQRKKDPESLSQVKDAQRIRPGTFCKCQALGTLRRHAPEGGADPDAGREPGTSFAG